jgi:hypothetical protein
MRPEFEVISLNDGGEIWIPGMRCGASWVEKPG